jgi:hypothetical protein
MGATACDARARVLELDPYFDRVLGVVSAKDLCVWIALAQVVDSVEHVLGAAVPELAVVEHRIDHRWRVARLDAAGVRQADEEALRIAFIATVTDALRGNRVVAVGSRIEFAANARGRKPGQGEVRGLELVVRTRGGGVGEVRVRCVPQARAPPLEDL